MQSGHRWSKKTTLLVFGVCPVNCSWPALYLMPWADQRNHVQLHLTMTMNNEYLHVHILACILYLHKNIMSDKQRFKLHWTFPLLLSPIPTSLTDKNELQLVLGTHTGMLTTVVWFFFFCPTVTCKDQTVLEMIRNRLQLFYQVVQSRALRNEP